MCKRVTRADQHQSLIRERPLCPVPSSTVRSGPSARPNQWFRNSHRRSAANSLFSDKSSFPNSCIFPSCRLSQEHSLLEEIAYGSFSGLIVVPPVSTWSRARNSGVRGPPPLRSRQSPMGIQGLSPKLLEQVRQHTEALELCVMALDVWCKSVPSRPFFFVAPEDRGGQQQHGPASIWQLAEVIAIVQRTREVIRSSAFACELRILHVPSPSSATCLFSAHASFKAGHSSGSKETSCSIQARSVAAVLVGRIIGHFEAWLTEDSSPRKSCRCFRSASGQRCCKQQTKPLGMALQVRREVFKSAVKVRTRSMGTLRHPGSPTYRQLLTALWTLSDKFMAASLPALAEASSHTPASRISHVGYRGSSISSGVAGVVPAVADGGFEQVHGPARDLAVESLQRSSPVEGAGTGSAKPVVGVVGACGLSDYGVVQVGRSAGSRNRDRSLSAELGSRLSRFNGSSWISFSSSHTCQTDAKPEVPDDQSSEFGHDEQPVQLESGEPVVHASDGHEVRGRVPLVLRSESEERVVHTSGEHEACERLPMVVPSRAWVDEVKTLKKGDVYVGRGSKQRGLLPSFWANRYKVSKFGRDRAVELHATEVQEDPQYRLRIHELSGKRLLCHCRPAEEVSRGQPP